MYCLAVLVLSLAIFAEEVLMNQFEVVIQEVAGRGPDGLPRPDVEIELLIDGEVPTELASVCIEPCALIASSLRDGEFFIGTCGCGEPGCAGVWHGIQVQHVNGITQWGVPIPYVRAKGDSSPPKPALMFEFSTSSYLTEVAKVKSFLVALLPREKAGARFSVDGHPGALVSAILKWIDDGFGGFSA